MALCGYCGKVAIAWQQHERKWVAHIAQTGADGSVLTVPAMNGTGRPVNRPVPDPNQPHYPHAYCKDEGGALLPSACASWTAQASALRPRGKRVSYRPRGIAAPVAQPQPATTIVVPPVLPPSPVLPNATPIGIGTVGSAPAKPKSMDPEAIMDAEDLAAWGRAEAAIKCALIPTRVLLWGRPGTGKTELSWRIAQAQGWTHIHQQMTEETPGTEMTGHLIVQGGNTVWCDGSLGRAIRASHEGHVVLNIDEIGRASQDAMSACLLALTNPESLRLTLRSGEVLAPKVEHWHVTATSNDEPGMLPPALADRLHIAVRVNAPHPDLVRSMTTREARRLAVAKSAEYSIRALLTYDRLVTGGMGVEDAARLVWEPEVASSFMDAARLEGGGR